jgi:hypothetical protein
MGEEAMNKSPRYSKAYAKFCDELTKN